jgi:hypothetical protein
MMQACYGTTVTGHLPAFTSRTAREPTNRCPALADAPTTMASARTSSATRHISVNGSPRLVMKVTEMPNSAATPTARCRISSVVAANASSLATASAAPPGPTVPMEAIGCTKTVTSLAPCRRARPIAYQPARSEVVESSTPTRITVGPSVPSSKASCSPDSTTAV